MKFLGCVPKFAESTSFWAYSFQVFVTGVDLIPIQFKEVPARCRFEIWDINTYDMPYEDAYFDLIHARDVHTGIRDYPRFLAQIGRILRPGGLVILIEPDLTQYADGKPELEWTFGSGPRGWFTLWETYRSCLSLLGVDVTVPQRLKQLLEETGLFENIEDFRGVIPVGFYPEGEAEKRWKEIDTDCPVPSQIWVS